MILISTHNTGCEKELMDLECYHSLISAALSTCACPNINKSIDILLSKNKKLQTDTVTFAIAIFTRERILFNLVHFIPNNLSFISLHFSYAS